MVSRYLSGLIAVIAMSVITSAQQPDLPLAVGAFPQELRTFYTKQQGLPSDDVTQIAIDAAGRVIARTANGDKANGDVEMKDGTWRPAADAAQCFAAKRMLPGDVQLPGRVLAVAHGPDGQIAVGTELGLFWVTEDGAEQAFPHQGNRRWAPTRVTVDYDGLGRLWFASEQGVGSFVDQKWSLYTGADGLPYDDLNCVACAADGVVWFGSNIGAIRFDGTHWSYRQGQRWLPHDEVREIALDADGNAWIATAGGVARIHFRQMTLADKAEYYEREIDQYHRRTEFGYVIEANTSEPGEKRGISLQASDNDGLWTSMYGAGECFAYGATKDPNARRRAQDAFDALRFLSEAPKGSPHQPPAGFIARTVLETASDRDPNAGAYTLEGQREMQQRDKQWRIYEPRWPKSADGKWYWKSDTSSDELDGHYFFYAAYFDLVAETEAQKAAVREVVRANIDHLIEHDFSLYDHAGRTRWAVYDPQELNHNPKWYVERGLNSISMLSYLNVAHHITGDQKYRDIARDLRDQHSYHINALTPKFQKGIGTGNQSDDEMAFMAFYNLIRYEPDPALRSLYLLSFAGSWRLEEPELNPFFNFCFAAVALDQQVSDNWGTFDLSPWPSWLDDSVDTLKRFPLDRFDWSHTNHHRKDLVLLSKHAAEGLSRASQGRGYRNNGKVLPVDERHFNHWNTDPWRLDSGGHGQGLADGAVFTLPYYMALYHGFIEK